MEPIRNRISAVLAMRRLRRRRVQVPLLVTSVTLFASGCIIYATGRASAGAFSYRWAYSPIFASMGVAAVAAMPGDVLFLRALCAGYGLMVSLFCVLQAGPAIAYLRLAVADSRGPPENLVTSYLYAVNTFVLAPGNALGMFALLVGSCTGVISALRLSTLLVRVLSLAFVLLAANYGIALTAFRPFEPRTHAFFPEERAAYIELLCAYLWLCLQCLSMGLFGLLRCDLRARVHGFLAMRGVGVDAAAGIAELLDGVKASDVLEQARQSFRAVPLDELSSEVFVQHLAPQHKNASLLRRAPDGGAGVQAALAQDAPVHAMPSSDTSATEVGDASYAAELGQVDAFVSHSWFDPPDAKWRALQAWGAEFKAAHGRAPLLWIDRACLDQTDLAAQLPSLPVYLAGCKSLLVLHGPTYLSRLWCVARRAPAACAHTLLNHAPAPSLAPGPERAQVRRRAVHLLPGTPARAARGEDHARPPRHELAHASGRARRGTWASKRQAGERHARVAARGGLGGGTDGRRQ